MRGTLTGEGRRSPARAAGAGILASLLATVGARAAGGEAPSTRRQIAPYVLPAGAPPRSGPSAGPCEPACGGRECGSDGCGGTCGACPPERRCVARGRCEACSSGGEPSFAAHTARRFRCYPDPVRGGSRCEVGAVLGAFAELAACERACHPEGASCAGSGPAGAACERCVQGCGEARAVPCVAGERAAPEGLGCRLEAGAWGNAEPLRVPATCPPLPGAGQGADPARGEVR